MLPGLQSNAVNKGAKTRFNNDRTKAAQASMTNQSAKGSMRLKQAGAQAPVRPPVGNAAPSQALPVADQGQIFNSQPNLGALQEGAQQYQPDPMADMHMQLATLNKEIELEKFLSSPLVQSAVTKSKLQSHFRRNRPDLPDEPTERLISNLFQM